MTTHYFLTCSYRNEGEPTSRDRTEVDCRNCIHWLHILIRKHQTRTPRV